MPDPLAAIVNEPLVTALASRGSFERGLAYLGEGRVGLLRVSSGRVGANVQGSEDYAVELSADDGRLRFACSCPVGRDGAFCKHCVAVALSWLRGLGRAAPTLDDATAYLGSLPPEALVELLIEHAHNDDRLARRLLLMASRPASAEAPALRGLIDQAFAHHGFVSYREMPGYVRGIEETIDLLSGLYDEGQAVEVAGLAEYALAAAERALEHIDDSDGQMGDVIGRLEELHLDACRRAGTDPVALAQRLFKRELKSDWGVFDCAVVRYADVLGDAGLARYRALAEERWATVPQLAPGEQSRSYSGTRFQITRIMEALAELSGSLADQIAVHERDLASGYSFVRIAELCRSHGDDDLALEWATRGIATFPDPPDPRLRSFLIEEYRRRGRSADALEHSLAAFAARPDIETYREIATDAQALGQWTERREAALALLRNPEAGPAAAYPWLGRRGHTELVRVLLWEGDAEAAWQAANDGGCTPDLWLELADRRRDEHPEDALRVYRKHVEDTIDRKDTRAYESAVRLIDDTIRALFGECGRPDDFAGYVAEARASHKPKRNLMKLMCEITTGETT